MWAHRRRHVRILTCHFVPPRCSSVCVASQCWAHAAISVIEAAGTRAGKTVVPLSPQFFVDCDRLDGQAQCSGGNPSKSFTYAKTATPATEAEYPYVAKPGTECKVSEGSAGFRVQESGLIVRCPATADLATQLCNEPDEVALLAALKSKGPLAVTVDASHWQAYDGGILPPLACKHSWTSANHAVVLVGYGHEDGKDFWLMLNSWSTRWGEEGLIRIQANVKNACGAANYAAFATVAP